ncbi:MAG: ADP-ribosylglycohydrolase family protein [Desulfopila sp.]
MKRYPRAMVLASFAADALAMPVHWIYDTAVIDRDFGRVEQILAPDPDSYHGSKQRGELTHYGDQALLLLHHLAENGMFDLNRFAASWQTFAKGYHGYIDKATQKTLVAMEAGNSPQACGSGSSDLGGPARIAPLVYWYRDDPERLLATAHEQTNLTHTGSGIDACTDFLVNTTLRVLAGMTPAAAIEEVIDLGIDDLDLDMRLRRCFDTVESDTNRVIEEFGQMCNGSAALPGAVHLILAYQDDLREALIANVMAGGDSAARGMVVGMILGAYQGIEAIADDWLSQMAATSVIKGYLERHA